MAPARTSFDLEPEEETRPGSEEVELPVEGSRVAGRFRVQREIGRGAIGVVYAGRVESGERAGAPCAIKLIRCDGPGLSERAVREGALLAALRGEHLVEVFASGVTPPLAWVVTELLEGEDLGERLLRVTRLPLPVAVRFAGQIASGLDLAHQAGVVHRDLKPSNVFLAREATGDRVKLLDFGLAKRLGDARLTASGALLGSPLYMAPEQIDRPSEVGPSADLWSFAVLLYRAVAGATPFVGSGGRLLAAIQASAHRPLRELDPALPPALDDFFAIALAKDKDARFQSVRALQRAFSEAATAG